MFCCSIFVLTNLILFAEAFDWFLSHIKKLIGLIFKYEMQYFHWLLFLSFQEVKEKVMEEQMMTASLSTNADCVARFSAVIVLYKFTYALTPVRTLHPSSLTYTVQIL